jgi:hypothetical protein
MKCVLGSLTVMAVALAGCTTEPGGDHPASDTKRGDAKTAAVVRPSWTTRIPAVGQPVMAGNVAVVIARASKDELDIVGLAGSTVAPATGPGGTHKRAAGSLRFPCTAAGKRAPGGLTNETIAGAAIAAPEGRYLIATSHGVSGYRLT